MDDHEQQLRQILNEIRERYMREARPIMAELAAINARKPPPPVIIDPESPMGVKLREMMEPRLIE